ncbi:glycosyltransferase [Desulfovibrio sp. JC010]|uniref:glycosyltransferase n=1 Tax=Desulfovibrio sp. JC010 TaxID=2593641 RepID=UPI0013D7F791|nr:glycosyltransferase [Desulfovibrio sp. JC010]NDV28343.1 glycosyltransferase [Desulfovibrio sp. JC010]
MDHIFSTYSQQILAYHLSGQKQEDLTPDAGDSDEQAKKHLRFTQRRNAGTVILFGAGDGKLAEAIAEMKLPDQELLLCDLYPEQVRRLHAENCIDFSKQSNCTLLTDSSLWAILLLLIQNGYSTEDCHLILNPALEGESKKNHQNLQKLFSGTRQIEQPETISGSISAGAILSPDEPELEEFIRNFPDWIDEIVLVWDCAENDHAPKLSGFHEAEIINIRQPLNADFSAQRNRMLEHCSGDWVIYMDADERLDADSWEKIRRIPSIENCNGWYLPRMTFYPDNKHSRIGYGLWPDLQLRLFKNTQDLKFVNKIHEQLTGIKGPSGILPHCPIQHLTHILKSREKIESKLKNFNNSTEGRFSHRLGNDFPHIPKELLSPRKDRRVGPLLLPDINLS